MIERMGDERIENVWMGLKKDNTLYTRFVRYHLSTAAIDIIVYLNWNETQRPEQAAFFSFSQYSQHGK
jgi:hypothetical protein